MGCGEARDVSHVPHTMAVAPSITLVIRFSSGILDLAIPVVQALEVTTPFLRRTIRTARPAEASLKRLRLLHNGRMLTGKTNFEREVFKYAVQPPPSASGAPPGPALLYIHCLIGDTLTPSEIADEDRLDELQLAAQASSSLGVPPPPSGFDRLADTGFSQADIEELRAQFRAMYGGASAGRSGEALRQLEDEWIDATVYTDGTDDFNNLVGRMNPTRAASAGSETTNRDLLMGLSMGCFFGVLCLLLMKDSSLWSKTVRKAMVVGMILNFFFGLTRVWY